MKVKGSRKVKLSDIQTNLFVRQSLDQDRVLYLATIIEDGGEMNDLMEITDLEDIQTMIDGRHRKAAYELNNIEEVTVKVLSFDDQAEMIAYAYKKNVGSLPPTAADTEHTITTLVKLNTTHKRIAELLNLPPAIVRRYVESIRSKERRAKLMRAEARWREENMTLSAAAEAEKVDLDELKTFVGAHKRRKGDVVEMQKKMTTLYKSVGSKNARLLKSLLEKFEDGDVSKGQVDRIFAKLEALQKQSIRSITDWKARFEALSNGAKKAAS